MVKKSEFIVGLDIGTTKIAAVVGQKTADGQIDIIGVGTHPSKGLRKGVVVNIEATVESIRKAVEDAEIISDCHIANVFAGVAGSHINSMNSLGIIAVKDKEVSHLDVERVIDAARAIAIPNDREIIHIFPQEYALDDQDGIKEPLGMSGVRLEAKVHIVTAAISSCQNIVKSANRLGLNVLDIVLEPIASAEAVLSPEEKELGVALIDIGGGTTDITIFQNGAVVHTAVIPLGGNNITNDIATCLRIPTNTAEELKKRYGTSLVKNVKDNEEIEVPSTGGREPKKIRRKNLAEIIQPRVDELLNFIQSELQKAITEGYLTAGVVLTGGSILLDGIAEVAEQKLNLPVRIGYPTGIGGLIDIVNSPEYATGVGLVIFGAKTGLAAAYNLNDSINEESLFEKIKNRIAEWLGFMRA
ncbi:MAG: cell division protein FtsA [Deltaproteobacteria bacterium]|nr:cell division protein FtsA [Deltaproteobacteria bacterium]